MSNSRQTPSKVRGYSITHPPGRVVLPTQPGWDSLVFAHAGLFTATSATSAWTVPTFRVLCVPDGTRIRIDTSRRVAIRCLYVAAELGVLDAELRVISLAPLARELLDHAIAAAPMTLDRSPDDALIALLADRLAAEPDAPLHIGLPSDPAAREVAEAIMAEPGVGLERHVRAANASRRTIERRFTEETRMSLGQWRRRARILAAVSMLTNGDSVTRVAVAVGYASPSAFVVAFRAELGTTPSEFMQR